MSESEEFGQLFNSAIMQEDMMNIGVCIKQVPDTACTLRIAADRSGVVEDDLKFIINPYDEYALEEALKTRDLAANRQVIVLAVGPKRAQEALRTALAMGADRAVHIETLDNWTPDPLAIAQALSEAIQTENIELVFTGHHGVDNDHGQVSQMLAALLAWPQIIGVNAFSMQNAEVVRVERDIDGGSHEVWEVSLPAVIGATKGLNQPRYASLKGIMMAKSKPLSVIAYSGHSTSKVRQWNYEVPTQSRANVLLQGETQDNVMQLVKYLREQAKVI